MVSVFAPSSTLALATQVSAPPPFDLFHDLRWIVVYHQTWVGFALELVAILVGRTALVAFLVRAAWPRNMALEPVSVTVRRSALFVLVVTLLLAPWVGVLFALAVVSLSWLFFVAVPVVLMLAVLVAGGAIHGSWWRDTISGRTVAIVVLAFAVVTCFGGLITASPPGWRVPIAALAGLVNAWLWVRLVDAVLRPRPTRRRIPVAPVGIVAVFALVVGGTVAGFALSQHSALQVVMPAAASATWDPVAPESATPLFVVTGFNTQWDGRTTQSVHLALPQRRFSYRGTTDGVAQPYSRADTHRSLRALAITMRSQVDAYHRATGQPITIVAESEGALLAKTYLAATPHAPVRNLVVLSPLVEPGRVYYPHEGAEGWGAFGGLELDGIAWALGGLSPVDLTPDTPFLRSIVDDGPAFRGLMSCALPGVRQAAVLPLDTGVSAPAPRSLGIPFTVVPAFHGGMLDDSATASVVAQVISGRRLSASTGWAWTEDAIQAAAAAWQVPALAPDVNDAWAHDPDAGNCRGIRAHLQRWVGRQSAT